MDLSMYQKGPLDNKDFFAIPCNALLCFLPLVRWLASAAVEAARSDFFPTYSPGKKNVVLDWRTQYTSLEIPTTEGTLEQKLRVRYITSIIELTYNWKVF